MSGGRAGRRHHGGEAPRRGERTAPAAGFGGAR